MKVSDKLKAQIERLQNTGAFVLGRTEKVELAELTKSIGCRELVNLDCGTCVRNAMYDVASFMNQKEERPKLQMKMVKSAQEMTYQELRKTAKAKGIKLGANPTKAQLIKAINEL